MGDDADTAELVAEIADEVKGSAASGGGRRVMHYASDGAMTYES